VNWTDWRESLGLPQVVLIILLGVLVLATFAASVSTATAFATYNSDWTGTTDLRDAPIADEDTSLVIDAPAAKPPAPTANTTAMVIGVPENTTAVAATSSAVLESGGTVVITDEVPETTNALLSELGATASITAGPIRDPQSYHRRPVLPLATTTNASENLTETELTLNHAGMITPGSATVMANTSQFAYIDANRNERFDADESLAARPVMTREPVANGTVILISDSSVFINAMYSREGNRAAATWLTTNSATVMLTGSSVRPLPRLAAFMLWIKSTPAAQTALLGTVSVVLLGIGHSQFQRAIKRIDRTETLQADVDSSQPVADAESVYESGLMSLLRTEHPEWDRDTLTRLVTAVTARRRQADASVDSEINNDINSEIDDEGDHNE